MAGGKAAQSRVEYGIRASNGKTILMVTDDPVEAALMLGTIGHGHLVRRRVSYTAWAEVEEVAPVDAGDAVGALGSSRG